MEVEDIFRYIWKIQNMRNIEKGAKSQVYVGKQFVQQICKFSNRKPRSRGLHLHKTVKKAYLVAMKGGA